MAKLPPYVTILLGSAEEEFDPGVISSEMERGLSKQRLSSARVVMRVACTLHFQSRQDTLAFDGWYFETIKRIGWFDILDPRTRQLRSVRFAGGSIGKLTALSGGFSVAQRAVVLEYLR